MEKQKEEVKPKKKRGRPKSEKTLRKEKIKKMKVGQRFKSDFVSKVVDPETIPYQSTPQTAQGLINWLRAKE